MSYNEMIDHVELSNEMQPYYMSSSASVLTDVSSLVTNYGATTTDHYPVFTRYAFDPVILPVTLVSFTVTKQNNTAILYWSTAQELNSKTFVAERSADNRNWAPVGSINAAGNSTAGNAYSLTDHAPENGINYYRLKQIDRDGSIQYSLIRKVSFDKKAFITVSPNPAKSFVNIYLVKNNAAVVTMDVIDMTGKVIHQVSTSASFLQMNTSKFAKGTYFIKVVNGKEIISQKLLIQ